MLSLGGLYFVPFLVSPSFVPLTVSSPPRDVVPAWLPIFEPDAAALGAIGDAILKVNQASEGFLGTRNIHLLTGLRSDAE